MKYNVWNWIVWSHFFIVFPKYVIVPDTLRIRTTPHQDNSPPCRYWSSWVQSEKWGARERALEREYCEAPERARACKWGGGGGGVSGTDFVGRVWLALWPAANPGPQSVRTGCSKPAVGGDERLERKEILKIISAGAAKMLNLPCS